MKGFNAVVHLVAVGVLMAMPNAAVAQQAYPSKPIRFISPNAPGGTLTILGRLVGQKITESWGQPVILENRPGANGVIGSEFVAKASPDGHTILLVNSTHVINAVLVANLPFDAFKDFSPIATLTVSQFLLAISAALPAHNLQEFIALATSRPGELNFASSGTGSVSHLAGEMFGMMTGVKMQHIPYNGAGPALADLIGGQVQLYFATPVATMPYITTGKVRAIGISGETRSPVLPQVPTFSEAGLSDFSAKNWFGVVASARTPKAIVDKLSTEIGKILVMPDIREKLANQGVDPFVSTPDQFAELMRAELNRYTKIVRTANIKLDN